MKLNGIELAIVEGVRKRLLKGLRDYGPMNPLDTRDQLEELLEELLDGLVYGTRLALQLQRILRLHKAKPLGKLVFLAHPVGGDVSGNIERGLAALKAYELANPGVAIVAPWISSCMRWSDSSPDQRSAQLERGLRTLERCDELYLCGPLVSPGMQEEINYARSLGIPIFDATELGPSKYI